MNRIFFISVITIVILFGCNSNREDNSLNQSEYVNTLPLENLNTDDLLSFSKENFKIDLDTFCGLTPEFYLKSGDDSISVKIYSECQYYKGSFQLEKVPQIDVEVNSNVLIGVDSIIIDYVSVDKNSLDKYYSSQNNTIQNFDKKDYRIFITTPQGLNKIDFTYFIHSLFRLNSSVSTELKLIIEYRNAKFSVDKEKFKPKLIDIEKINDSIQ